jgi:enamine deaminase RidA (YjgF/YER057c/UK114 family)
MSYNKKNKLYKGTMFMNTKINPQGMKQPKKAYSNGILSKLGEANILFVTGQLAQDDQGVVVAPNDYEKQSRFIFEHIGLILKDAGMSFDDVVKANIYVKDIKNSGKVSAIRDEFFANSKPASTMVQVGGFVKDECCVEIEIVAIK